MVDWYEWEDWYDTSVILGNTEYTHNLSLAYLDSSLSNTVRQVDCSEVRPVALQIDSSDTNDAYNQMFTAILHVEECSFS